MTDIKLFYEVESFSSRWQEIHSLPNLGLNYAGCETLIFHNLAFKCTPLGNLLYYLPKITAYTFNGSPLTLLSIFLLISLDSVKTFALIRN